MNQRITHMLVIYPPMHKRNEHSVICGVTCNDVILQQSLGYLGLYPDYIELSLYTVWLYVKSLQVSPRGLVISHQGSIGLYTRVGVSLLYHNFFYLIFIFHFIMNEWMNEWMNDWKEHGPVKKWEGDALRVCNYYINEQTGRTHVVTRHTAT